jgi:hypothetical protein
MNLNTHKAAFNRVGWFIPPYASVWFLGTIQAAIDTDLAFDQKKLERLLSRLYSADHLAAMVCGRYPMTPYVAEYKDTIAEAVEAHFSGLGHVAFAGLMPAIEGIGRKLAASRCVNARTLKGIFAKLADDCTSEVIAKQIGDVDEIIAMMGSFNDFTENVLYVRSGTYKLGDNTNRNPTLHGEYSDADYGQLINFYKTIAAVDFLCMISALRARVSWFAPSPTQLSKRLADYYRACTILRSVRPT